MADLTTSNSIVAKRQISEMHSFTTVLSRDECFGAVNQISRACVIGS